MVEPYKIIYTISEVAQILRMNKNQVYGLLNSGALPYLKLGSRKVRGTDLEQFINNYPTGERGTEQ